MPHFLQISVEITKWFIFINESSILDKYLRPLKNEQNTKYTLLSDYFTKFFDFCFELRLENMIEGCNKFKY